MKASVNKSGWKIASQPSCDCDICQKIVDFTETYKHVEHRRFHSLNTTVDLSLCRILSGIPVELRQIIHTYISIPLDNDTIREAITQWNIFSRRTIPANDRKDRALLGKSRVKSGDIPGEMEAFEHQRVLLKYGHISFWDTSYVTDMFALFTRYPDFIDCISYWDVEQVIDMSEMFSRCRYFNQPLFHWNVSKVQDMSLLFYGCNHFNQFINNWNVLNVKDMSGLFHFAERFNQPLNKWNVSNVENMANMFTSTYAFNQLIDMWQVHNVTNLTEMFRGSVVFNQPLSSWNTSKVKDMSAMFRYARSFNQDISNWDVSSVEDMNNMFCDCPTFDQSLAKWNVQKVVYMTWMFSGCKLECRERHRLLVQAYNDRVQNNKEAQVDTPVDVETEWDLRSLKDYSHMFHEPTS